MNETELISRAETARLLGVSLRTVNRYVSAGRLTPTYERHRGQFVPRYERLDVLNLARQVRVPRNRPALPEDSVPKPVCS